MSNHLGGHCQFGISYNNGVDIVVIETILSRCFNSGNSFDIKLPSTLPDSDNVLFVWSWVNAFGKREYYVNCVDIKIRNPNTDIISFTGPENLIVNLPGYPIIPEFYDGERTDLFYNRKNITVNK